MKLKLYFFIILLKSLQQYNNFFPTALFLSSKIIQFLKNFTGFFFFFHLFSFLLLDANSQLEKKDILSTEKNKTIRKRKRKRKKAASWKRKSLIFVFEEKTKAKKKRKFFNIINKMIETIRKEEQNNFSSKK